jgi:Protein of unknown function (DUF3716)
MTRRVPFLALLALAFTLTLSARAVAQLLSPGPLAGPHASLDSDDKCDRCHTSGKGVANSLCLNCHVNVGGSSGMHGTAWKGQACGKCHSDHRGRGFALVRFDAKSFNHGQIWTLNGSHASAKCGACHKSASFIGLSRGCPACHKDVHGGRFGACLNCHNESAWGQVRIDKFDHNLARFQLRGAHASVACQNCHGSPARYRGLDFGGCASCHHDPHGGRFGKECTNCHVESTFHEVHMKPGVHPGVSLGGGHARVACTRCHDRGQFSRPSRGGRCISCHKAVHEAPFGNRCESCHYVIKWFGLPKKVSLSAHDKTAFVLHGKHVQAPCSGCHKPSEPEAKRYRKLVFDKCRACHSDEHKGEFAKRSGGECTDCHSDSGFAPTLFGAEAHAGTHFPLIGHHVAVPCDKCHANHKPEERRLDWRVVESKCVKCHENPHGTQFEKEMKKHGCAGCHSSVGWDVPNIDHSIWPLTGAHASAPCGRCHTPTDADKKQGRGASYKNTPHDCEGCHKDVHKGQFRLGKPVKSCGFCHGTTRFLISVFDHQKLAGYPLDGAHRRLECNRCHAIQKLRDGGKTTRWRLGYQRCRDCHADPHSEGG